MELIILIVSLVFSFLSFIGVVILLIRVSKQKGISSQGGSDLSNLEKAQIQSSSEIKASIDSMEKNLGNIIEAKVTEKAQAQMVWLVGEMKNQADSENARLNQFKNSIEERLQSQNNVLSNRIDENLKEIRSKNEQQMLQIQTSLNQQSRSLYDSSQSQLKMIRDSLSNLTSDNTKQLNLFEQSISSSLTLQIQVINDRIDSNMKTINEKVDQGLSQGFKGASESMQNLQKQLGIVQEAQKNISSLQNEISSLNGILSNNQQRGRFGEWQLELLLENMFQAGKGTLYETQYVIQEARGEEKQLKPDAVIFLDGQAHHQMVCIDSKFSLVGYEELFDLNKHLSEEESESCKARFHTALKQRIEETGKYIIKGKTLQNSIMFVPNDGVFAYLYNAFPDLVDYAKKKGVVLVSPTILQPLLASFRLIQIDAKKSKNIAKINEALNTLGQDFKRFMPRWEKLSKSIRTLSSDSEKFTTTVNKIGSRFEKVQNIELSDSSSENDSLEDSIDENQTEDETDSEEESSV